MRDFILNHSLSSGPKYLLQFMSRRYIQTWLLAMQSFWINSDICLQDLYNCIKMSFLITGIRNACFYLWSRILQLFSWSVTELKWTQVILGALLSWFRFYSSVSCGEVYGILIQTWFVIPVFYTYPILYLDNLFV